MKFLSEIKFEIEGIKTGRKDLVKFGLIVGPIFVLLGFFFGTTLWVVGGLLIVFGVLSPSLLRYPYLAWMSFAVIMGFFVFRFLLVILYYVTILPMGLISRIVGRDVMKRNWGKRQESYWIPHTSVGSPTDPY